MSELFIRCALCDRSWVVAGAWQHDGKYYCSWGHALKAINGKR